MSEEDDAIGDHNGRMESDEVSSIEYIIDLMGAPGALIPAEIPSSPLPNTVVNAKGSAYSNETFKDLSLVIDTVAAAEEINPHFEEIPSVCRPSLEPFSSYGAQPSGNKE